MPPVPAAAHKRRAAWGSCGVCAAAGRKRARYSGQPVCVVGHVSPAPGQQIQAHAAPPSPTVTVVVRIGPASSKPPSVPGSFAVSCHVPSVKPAFAVALNVTVLLGETQMLAEEPGVS